MLHFMLCFTDVLKSCPYSFMHLSMIFSTLLAKKFFTLTNRPRKDNFVHLIKIMLCFFVPFFNFRVFNLFFNFKVFKLITFSKLFVKHYWVFLFICEFWGYLNVGGTVFPR